ncbi:MAG: selenocysteine-specific translation elongation factor [Dehalococcoidia bacterium]|nr:selenocysteine-specific translation elongation factor [Dehalococcoidia bacterium]
MLTLATAGHIDHGKSSLVKALTSIDPDRLPEEKKRAMTIDLGFAWLELPNKTIIGLIDVPGHKQFVHNVIPGLFGIDAALLVVAADDGWMPQTEEHLQILSLLGIKQGIVALNKTDLVNEPEWLEVVESDIMSHLENSTLKDAPIVRVSARSGEGLACLTNTISCLAQKLTPRENIGKARLPIDRVFVIKGSGIVVTGTLSQGELNINDNVRLLPTGHKAHIRGIQSFKKGLSSKVASGRLALNLTGIKREYINRGNVVTTAQQTHAQSRYIDVHLTLLEGITEPLRNMAEVVVFLETNELRGRVILIGQKTLKHGEETTAQLRFSEEVPTYIGERFIIRRPSPSLTIGGGVVLDPQASKLKTAEIPPRHIFLQKRLTLKLDDLILSEVSKKGWCKIDQLLFSSTFCEAEINERTEHLARQNQLIVNAGYAIQSDFWHTSTQKLLDFVSEKYRENPLHAGTPQIAIQTAVKLPLDVFDILVQQLVSTGKLVRVDETLCLPGSKPVLNPQQKFIEQSILDIFTSRREIPPTIKEINQMIPNSQPVIYYLIKNGRITDLGDGILIETEHFNQICALITDILRQNGSISIQEINLRFGFSRKYSVPLLTFLDRLGITRRDGDIRRPGRKLQ